MNARLTTLRHILNVGIALKLSNEFRRCSNNHQNRKKGRRPRIWKNKNINTENTEKTFFFFTIDCYSRGLERFGMLFLTRFEESEQHLKSYFKSSSVAYVSQASTGWPRANTRRKIMRAINVVRFKRIHETKINDNQSCVLFSQSADFLHGWRLVGDSENGASASCWDWLNGDAMGKLAHRIEFSSIAMCPQ